ncbi:MAG: class I SAM-dependent methyltransferase [Acetatifactor sp.]
MENISDNTYSTIEYYNQNTMEFVNATIGADMSDLYAEFEKYIDSGGKVLDLGCGSGRDSQYFYKKGYQVIAIDPSSAMCNETRRRVPIDVFPMRAEEMGFSESFDAVWACASLIHVAKEDMRATVSKIMQALKLGGIFYASWKYGYGEQVRQGRYFAYFTEKELLNIFKMVGNLQLLRIWITEDVKAKKEDIKWLNILAKKT